MSQVLAAYVQDVLDHRGIPIREAARLCQLSDRTVRRVLNGAGGTRPSTLAKLAAGLGLSADLLATLHRTNGQSPLAQTVLLVAEMPLLGQRQTQDLVALFAQAPPAGRRQILELVHVLTATDQTVELLEE